jgi:hypothetical protein
MVIVRWPWRFRYQAFALLGRQLPFAMRWYDPNRWEITAKLAAMLIGIWIGAGLFWILAWPYHWWPEASALIGGVLGGLCGVCLGGHRIGVLGSWCLACTVVATLLGGFATAAGGLVLGLIGGLIHCELMARRGSGAQGLSTSTTPAPGPAAEAS